MEEPHIGFHTSWILCFPSWGPSYIPPMGDGPFYAKTKAKKGHPLPPRSFWPPVC